MVEVTYHNKRTNVLENVNTFFYFSKLYIKTLRLINSFAYIAAQFYIDAYHYMYLINNRYGWLIDDG